MIRKRTQSLLSVIVMVFSLPLTSLADATDDATAWLDGFRFRLVGPALTSGRIVDFAVNPRRPAEYFAAAASGGLWKTVNAGTTWTPVFDDQGSYSIGALRMDPDDPLVLWVGTGENNSQRSVSYGDGVYLTRDGGATWENMGLTESEHIGMFAIDPRDTDVVFVAAQGPLWRSGGDRGLYRTADAGKTWERVLHISDDTGVSEVHMDPRDPDVLYAVAYQRRRHVWTLLNGGPESGIHKSLDGGETWTELTRGLPEYDLGRIGLAIAPSEPDTVYAIVEATGDESGFYRSRDGGSNWTKMSDYVSSSPQYYQEIIPDPHNPLRVYSLDTFLNVTEDGGANFSRVSIDHKHVDDHALWIDPNDTDHLLNGCDGGIYETWDRGAHWHFKPNLPITQFYRVSADNDTPFYNVYGGTQDNNSLGAPSRSTSASGIVNMDWEITLTGDGYETQVDPTDANVLYSQYQHGGLVRFDRLSGESVDIQPQPAPGDAPLKWNWDTPLLLSPHLHTRLYFAANRLYRTDDRGNNWTAVSPDLTRRLDRNRLEIMGRVWSVDAVAKNQSTSFFGNIVSLDESPRVEDLLYVGTDDGLIQVSGDGGAEWRRIDRVRGVPQMTYVSDLAASLHDDDTVFAAFDNHKNGDFNPYLYRSTDRGRSWTSIAGDLPKRGSVYTVVQDHVDAKLLFAGTEFGVFVTMDGGSAWHQMSGDFPVIAVRDLEVQRRETDLVVGTFGRGIYILDNYAPLRGMGAARDAAKPALFGVKDPLMFVPRYPLGHEDQASLGDGFYTAPNPPPGAVVTYYLPKGLESARDERLETERAAAARGEDVFYPEWDALRAEDAEDDPRVVLVVRDASGGVVRRVEGPTAEGVHRVVWDFRFPPPDPAATEAFVASSPWDAVPVGPAAMPGGYTVTMEIHEQGEIRTVGPAQSFSATPLGLSALPAPDRAELMAFQRKTAQLQRAVLGAESAVAEAQTRIDHLAVALRDTPAATPRLAERLERIETALRALRVELEGDATVSGRSEATLPGIASRVSRLVWGHWYATTAATGTQRANYRIAADAFGPWLERLRTLMETQLAGLEADVEAAGGPWTPGRIPRWSPN